MKYSFDSNIIFVNDEHPLNAYIPIFVTLDGIVIVSKYVFLSNADFRIVVNSSGKKFNVVSFVPSIKLINSLLSFVNIIPFSYLKC